jgi:tripartite-type tricarboxylate transporter receptor subunit TctC
MLVVHPSLPVKKRERADRAREVAAGSDQCRHFRQRFGLHLALEIFNRMAGVRLMRIPYNGDGPAIVDRLGGRCR